VPRKVRELKADLQCAMSDPAGHYSMVIEWSDEDQAYIVTVPELPGCRTHGLTYEEPGRQGQDAIESWIEAQRASERPIPAPRVFAGESSR
jgi:predicted RNase H-like HicB family nuclease